VGKTELARSLARRLGFGEEAFFVFNMSEYGSDSARTRFMGADPGYIGFKSTRTIYDMVRARPSCVILLDEIDRSDASIQDILLSILEGEGKDSEGDPVYFTQAVFIMTTNLGQEQVVQAYEQAREFRGLAHPLGRYGGRPALRMRERLADDFPPSHLRRLILEGVLDEAEAQMKKFLDRQVADAKVAFLASGGETADSDGPAGLAIQRFVELRGLQANLEQTRRRSPLDRAFMDRVDFIFPFFPIKEPRLLFRILDLHLHRSGWSDCPGNVRRRIVREALREKESVRPLQRLIKQYRAASTG
jgi:ATP-dependent Clp protease ATP-binding subunit ClpA